MDYIKSQFDRIQQQLSGLTPSQKMLSAALVVIMVMTLWWWGKYAATPEYEPMLTQGFSADEITIIATQLKSSGIDHKVAGNQILVPPDKMFEAVAYVGYADVMPKNTTSGFDEMIKQLTPWDGVNRQDSIFNHGKELSLQRIIAHFPGVKSATVLIDPAAKFRLSGELEPTATVDVKMRDLEAAPPKRLAQACAHLVAGAQAGLKISRVHVTINGSPFPIGDEGAGIGGFSGGSTIEMQNLAEAHENKKLQKHLSYIPGVHVSVAVKIDSTSKSTEKLEVDRLNSGVYEKKSQSTSTEELNIAPAGGEAGVPPNTGIAIANQPVASAGPQSTRNQTQDTVEYENVPATTKTNEVKPAGGHVIIGASVRVPRSYLVREANKGDPNAKEPDAATLKEATERVLESVKAAVTSNTGLNSDAITVDPYTDLVVPPPQMEVATASSFSLMLGGHMKEIALGGLAIASLFMMSMIVRKGTAAPAAVFAASSSAGPSVLSASEGIVGEATGHDPALDGMELDDESIETQQMLSQVTSLIGESPDTAAQLIKRWMNQR